MRGEDRIDRKPSQAARRAELMRQEGCILCRARIATKRYYLRAKDEDMVYHVDQEGDYLLCPWHQQMIAANWYGDAAQLKEIIKVALRERGKGGVSLW